MFEDDDDSLEDSETEVGQTDVRLSKSMKGSLEAGSSGKSTATHAAFALADDEYCIAASGRLGILKADKENMSRDYFLNVQGTEISTTNLPDAGEIKILSAVGKSGEKQAFWTVAFAENPKKLVRVTRKVQNKLCKMMEGDPEMKSSRLLHQHREPKTFEALSADLQKTWTFRTMPKPKPKNGLLPGHARSKTGGPGNVTRVQSDDDDDESDEYDEVMAEASEEEKVVIDTEEIPFEKKSSMLEEGECADDESDDQSIALRAAEYTALEKRKEISKKRKQAQQQKAAAVAEIAQTPTTELASPLSRSSNAPAKRSSASPVGVNLQPSSNGDQVAKRKKPKVEAATPIPVVPSDLNPIVQGTTPPSTTIDGSFRLMMEMRLDSKGLLFKPSACGTKLEIYTA